MAGNRRSALRKFYVAGLLLVCALPIAYWYANRVFRKAMSDAAEFKSAKEALGTVQSVTKLALGATIEMGLFDSPENSSAKQQLYKVCFTFDEFNEIPLAYRSRYMRVERSRGEECQNTSRVDLALRLKAGDKVKVTYLLENNDQLDVAQVKAFGECLSRACQ